MRVIRPEPPSLAFVAPASRATRRAVLLGSALGLQRTPLLLPTQEESHAVYVLLAVLAALVVAWVAVT